MHHRFFHHPAPLLFYLVLHRVADQGAQTERKLFPEPAYQSVFDEYGLEACFVLADQSGNLRKYHNQSRSDSGYIPASTFKIPNSVIALSEGVVDTTTVIPWDGKKRTFDSWNQDQTLFTAFQRLPPGCIRFSLPKSKPRPTSSTSGTSITGTRI